MGRPFVEHMTGWRQTERLSVIITGRHRPTLVRASRLCGPSNKDSAMVTVSQLGRRGVVAAWENLLTVVTPSLARSVTDSEVRDAQVDSGLCWRRDDERQSVCCAAWGLELSAVGVVEGRPAFKVRGQQDGDTGVGALRRVMFQDVPKSHEDELLTDAEQAVLARLTGRHLGVLSVWPVTNAWAIRSVAPTSVLRPAVGRAEPAMCERAGSMIDLSVRVSHEDVH